MSWKISNQYKIRLQKKPEKFADSLDIAVTNLKKAKREDELGNGTFYRTILCKLPERMLAQYNRGIFKHKEEIIETFRSFTMQEAEF